jgi:hypothetical protein
LLYVAITRPRKRLVVFDTDRGKRQPIFDLMLHKGLVQSNWDPNDRWFQPGTVEGWLKRGRMMWGEEHYEDALHCFMQSGNELLANKARAKIEMANGEKKEKEKQWVEASERFRAAAAVYEAMTAEGHDQAVQWKHAVERAARCLKEGAKYGEAAAEFERVDMWKVSGQKGRPDRTCKPCIYARG